MNTELTQIAQKLEQATAPEEVFGPISYHGDEGLAQLKQRYRQYAKLTHPDHYSDPVDQEVAQAAFTRLTGWYSGAEAKMRAGVYGRPANAGLTLQTKKRLYHLDGSYSEGQVYINYPGWVDKEGQPVRVLLKVVRDPRDNDRALNEAQVIQALRSGPEAARFAAYIPRLMEAFAYSEDGTLRQGSAFEQPEGWYSLAEVRRAYPAGVDPKDMVWMWRRLLTVLGFAHRCQVIHSAVLPSNILIQPELHGLMLCEWSYAVDNLRSPMAVISSLDPVYADWYPEEVKRGEPPLPGTDIAMAARCMIDLLGGHPIHNTLPDRVPPPIQRFLTGCNLPGKSSRPQDAWAVLEEFDQCIRQLWGERKFHPFYMKS